MIAFLDVANKTIKLYTDKGLKEIPFNQANTLNYHLSGSKTVVYVTQAIKANVKDVIDLAFAQVGSQPSKEVNEPKNDPLHVRYTGKGILNISELGITNKDGILEPETFHGPVDFKPLSILEKKGFNESSQVQGLLRSGKLEVIPLSVCRNIRLEWERANNHDAELDKIVIPDGMSQAEYIKKLNSGEIIASDSNSDAIEIDLLASGFGKGQSAKNEGSLLPSDFRG